MIRPLRDRIVIKPIDEKLSTVLEVVQFDKKVHRGEVLAVGPSVKFDEVSRPRGPTDAQVGDTVRFTEIYKFPDIIDHGERVLILQEADICFIEEREAA